jgi:hypothetical protein
LKDFKLPPELVGKKFSETAIKRFHIRIRNHLKKQENRQPVVFRLKLENGIIFKLLKSKQSDNFELKRISENISKIKDLHIAPKIVQNNINSLLVEYIEGVFPNPEDNSFCLDLASIFAKLHNVDSSLKDTSITKHNCQKDIDFLYSSKLINKLEADKLNRILDDLLPEKMVYGISYTDHNMGNFIYDKNGKLWLIDLGSFQSELPLDMYLPHGRLKNIVASTEFENEYISNGGYSQIFEHQKILKVIASIRAAAMNKMILSSEFWSGLGKLIPILDFRLIQARSKNLKKTIFYLKNL